MTNYYLGRGRERLGAVAAHARRRRWSQALGAIGEQLAQVMYLGVRASDLPASVRRVDLETLGRMFEDLGADRQRALRHDYRGRAGWVLARTQGRGDSETRGSCVAGHNSGALAILPRRAPKPNFLVLHDSQIVNHVDQHAGIYRADLQRRHVPRRGVGASVDDAGGLLGIRGARGVVGFFVVVRRTDESVRQVLPRAGAVEVPVRAVPLELLLDAVIPDDRVAAAVHGRLAMPALVGGQRRDFEPANWTGGLDDVYAIQLQVRPAVGLLDKDVLIPPNLDTPVDGHTQAFKVLAERHPGA